MRRDPTTARGDAAAKYKALYGTGAYEEALAIAQAVLAVAPDDDDAREMTASCEGALRGRYLAKLGSMQTVPQATRTPRGSVDLEPKAMFLLTHIDGVSTIEEIVDVSGVREIEALRLLVCLVTNGYVTV